MAGSSTRHSSPSTPQPPVHPAGPAVPEAPQAPQQPAVLQVPQQPATLQGPQQMVHLNWSHFKPEFLGKPDENTEAHLLHTNNWMNAHILVEGVQSPKILSNTIRRSQIMVSYITAYYCRLAKVTKFRQQYSEIGNTREQLLHAWRSFSFDENTETMEAYVTCIRQVSPLLGYGEKQNLRGIQKHTPHTIVLDTVSYRRP